MFALIQAAVRCVSGTGLYTADLILAGLCSASTYRLAAHASVKEVSHPVLQACRVFCPTGFTAAVTKATPAVSMLGTQAQTRVSYSEVPVPTFAIAQVQTSVLRQVHLIPDEICCPGQDTRLDCGLCRTGSLSLTWQVRSKEMTPQEPITNAHNVPTRGPAGVLTPRHAFRWQKDTRAVKTFSADIKGHRTRWRQRVRCYAITTTSGLKSGGFFLFFKHF